MSGSFPDVVVLIPGITGSVLQRDGKDVWAPTAGVALRAVLSLGHSIEQLELRGGDDPAADDLGDGITATRVLPDLHVLPGLNWKIDGYGRIGEELKARLGCVAGENYFEFPYDWRRDNRVAARKLARDTHAWLRRWRERSGNDGAKLVLVCHSMGGVVARIFAELEGGAAEIRTLVTFGTPYSGSINALEFLVNGFRKGWGPFTVDLSRMIRSFTSVYQLLPSYRCLEGRTDWLRLDDPGVDWSMSELDTNRLADSLALHRNLRSAVDTRLATGSPGYDLRPIIGDAQPTGWAARLDGSRIAPMLLRDLNEQGGDGTVPKISATPHELLGSLGNATFVGQRHASLQNDDAVLTHVGGVLRTPLLHAQDVFSASEAIALQVEDTTTTSPLTVRASCQKSDADLVATVTPLTPLAGRPAGQDPMPAVPLTRTTDGWWTVDLPGLPDGDYRIAVGGKGLRATTDVASVVDLATLEADATVAGGG